MAMTLLMISAFFSGCFGSIRTFLHMKNAMVLQTVISSGIQMNITIPIARSSAVGGLNRPNVYISAYRNIPESGIPRIMLRVMHSHMGT